VKELDVCIDARQVT